MRWRTSPTAYGWCSWRLSLTQASWPERRQRSWRCASNPAGRPVAHMLLDILRTQHLLLVLDNCEPVLPAAAGLADSLLRACEGIMLLASSREPLGISGERVWPVPPLSVPELHASTNWEGLSTSEAVQLFLVGPRPPAPISA